MIAFPPLSVVVPVYNSAEIFPALTDRLTAILESMGGDYEVLLVNDGSGDESWNCITRV
jgi:polyisoprenyl-phosphate glycosyltransferase